VEIGYLELSKARERLDNITRYSFFFHVQANARSRIQLLAVSL